MIAFQAVLAFVAVMPSSATGSCSASLLHEASEGRSLLQAGRVHADMLVAENDEDAFIQLNATNVFQRMSPSEIDVKLKAKQGLNANAIVGLDTLNKFIGTSSWFWTYALKPEEEALKWGLANNKEFVPLVNLKRPLPKGEGTCSFQDGTCTAEMLAKALKATKATGITMEYLMGFNEPYASHQEASSYGQKGLKSVSGEEAAEWWRKVVQPAADQAGLRLVSPTTGSAGQKVAWLIEFLQACYDRRSLADHPCKVEKIEVFSVHEYKCYAGYWRKYFATDGGDDVEVKDPSCKERFKPRKEVNFYTSVMTAMHKAYTDPKDRSFWAEYIGGVKLWVTETSCSGDIDWDKVQNEKKQTPTAAQSCQYITGQSCIHQEGSIEAILGMDNIERFSWFTMMPNPPTKHPNYESIMAARLFDAETKVAQPPGRALMKSLDASEAECLQT
eukprot:TRINITY_DN44969_c0_g1_i1.p1 TRINITY_DN44969_c0_g1~~TRINITY_DN44969_c0_g1_i1.p1  ORF type:complete len:475 (+),score=93.56 TRINITY_DN44969_c0_g1_i1:92-1426(+)